MHFQIGLVPITKKNSQQIVKAGTRLLVIPSKQYKQYEKDCAAFIPQIPFSAIDTPVNVKCLYYMPTRRRVDLTNLLQSTLDVLVKYGVLADDNSNIVVSMDGSRVLLDRDNPRTEIDIESLNEK